MKIAENSVVSFHYTLTNGAGELVDTSREGEPLPYLHGANNIVQGLEEALVGKQSGDKLQVEVPPHLGYGEYMEEMVQQVDRQMFAGIDTLEVGMQFHAEGDSGQQQVVTITAIEGDMVSYAVRELTRLLAVPGVRDHVLHMTRARDTIQC